MFISKPAKRYQTVRSIAVYEWEDFASIEGFEKLNTVTCYYNHRVTEATHAIFRVYNRQQKEALENLLVSFYHTGIVNYYG